MRIPARKAPINAAEIIPISEPKKLNPDIKERATNKLAPEFMPKTYGPAKGLLNNVCINIPERASPPPRIIEGFKSSLKT
jgi:hypothetical protein